MSACACLAHALKLQTDIRHGLLACASLSYAFDEADQVPLFLQEAGQWFARFLDTNKPVSLSDHAIFLAVALLRHDQALVHLIAGLPRERCTHPSYTFDETAFLAAEFFNALATGNDRIILERLERMPEASARSARLAPTSQTEMSSIFSIARAIVERNAAGLDAGAQARHEVFVARFREPRIRNTPEGLLDYLGLGLLRLAAVAGVEPRFESV